LVNNSY